MFRRRLVSLSIWIIVFVGILYFIFFSPFFRVKEVVVNKIGMEKLYKNCKGKNIFIFSLSRKGKEIEKNPRIKKVIGRKVLPSKIIWEVNFRDPILCFMKNRKWFGVDEEGVVFSVKKPKIYPILIWNNEVKEGEISPDLKNTVLIYKEMKSELPNIEILSIKAEKDEITLRIKGGIKVIFSQGNISKEVENLKKILENVRIKHYIDLRFGNDVIVK